MRRFKSAHQRDSGRRFAGKLYLDCPTHGRFGVDAKPGFQDWILEHAKIDGALEQAAAAAEPETKPATPAPAPAASSSSAPAPKKRGFGIFPS